MMKSSQYEGFWKFIKLLDDNDLLEHIILIGSWAEYLYAQSCILPGFKANLRTLDIDFLIKNMRRPIMPVSVATLAKISGYTVDYDIMLGTTKIYSPDLLEIEFLISQHGSGEKQVIETNLGVNAQALRHLSSLKDYTINLSLFDFQITVPIPEAYIAQKIAINNERGKKAEKDRQAILGMMPYLDNDLFQEIRKSMTKKENQAIEDFLKLYDL
ncbi:MAG: GSU2403 family nucleotidyltransferase fold protein [Clostridia bacterium]